MQWETDPAQHLKIVNQSAARGTRHGDARGDGFAYASPTAWDAYEVNKPVAEGKGAATKKERKLWTVGERLDRTSFGQTTRELPSSLLSTVYGLLAFSMAFTAAGIVAGYGMGPGYLWLLVLANIALVFAVIAWREIEYLNLVLLYSFSATTGLMLGR